jgi:DNA-binding GntR family transcriptional regulator
LEYAGCHAIIASRIRFASSFSFDDFILFVSMSILSDKVYQHIRSKIASGELPGGSMLSEIALAKEVKVSRTPVREAITQLSSEGFLDQIPRLGTFVRVMGLDEINELYDLRAELEGFAANRAAQIATSRQIAELREKCAAMREVLALLGEARKDPSEVPPATLTQKWILAESAFHATIIKAGANRWVSKVANDLQFLSRTLGDVHKTPGMTYEAEWSRALQEHLALIGAIESHDSDRARKLISEHIRRGQRNAIENIGRANRLDAAANEDPDPLFRRLNSLEHYMRTRSRKS